ncbi:restriction endonuclease subunit S [Salinimicrobium sp. CDJ15-91]|uniref:Restriction endonuclease subunit S n=2 Tax=Salinimicrobium oceani TaxID=2722702 RepID=A0ABX1D252_9FLAO|nr:restriction endonuclease subunit S [Salinimicrobium oceani]
MQKIFSQEIRFKDEDGKEYPVWNKKKLRDILTYEQPTKYLVESTEYDNGFETPVLTAGKTFILGYTDETEGIFTKLPVIIFDDFTTAFKYVDFPFKAKSSAMKMLIPNSNEVNIKFVFEAMGRIKFPLAEHKRYWISEFQHMKIPYPCIEEQSKIATFLTSIDRKIALVQKQIDGSNQFKKGLLQQMFV